MIKWECSKCGSDAEYHVCENSCHYYFCVECWEGWLSRRDGLALMVEEMA